MFKIQETATHVIQHFLDEQVNVVEQTRQFLEILSHVPAIRELHLDECNRFLQNIHQKTPQYSTIVVATPDGLIPCCAIPLQSPINVTDRNWFKRTHETHDFVIDNFLISRSAKRASLPFAYPVLSASNNIQVIVGAAFDLAYYQTIVNKASLPQDTVAIAVDRQETILYQSSEEGDSIGISLAENRGFTIPHTRSGYFTVQDIDGIERIYWFKRLEVGQPSNEICLLIGISKKAVFAKANQFLLQNISILAIVAFTSFAIAWIFSGKFLLSPLEHLVQKTRHVVQTGLHVLPNAFEQTGEFRILSEAFDQMILTLSQREQERDEAIRTLKEREDRLKFALEGANDGLWDFRPQTGAIYYSPRWFTMLGYEPDELDHTYETWQQLLHPEDRMDAERQVSDLLHNNKALYAAEFRMQTKDRTWVWIISRGKVVERDEQLHPTRIVGTHTDITARKQAEAALHELNTELEQRVQQRTAEIEAVNEELKNFAYIVSHDLKAPLRGINQLANWLAHDYANTLDQEGQRYINLLINRVTRMDNLINGILEYSRVGRIVNSSERIALTPLVQEIIESLAPSPNILIQIEQELPIMVADRTRITQVFQNLLSNAVKFIDKTEGYIQIRCEDLDTQWKFCIIDNGPGIDARYHEKVFQIFQTLIPGDQNTGIGLAVVKRIVELYGGKIWLESTPGQGSSFFFTLPKRNMNPG